ncbi:hypothetical protein H5410_047862 [Solanum commersonii]|uniref:Uncharacterized protein n=1 Tax=Solanum commersonii TaxID=4109 RepID=A0A9J5XJH5_SOLCO|nr:hypothetical protein H5410_047862 [Solanum commersonii]
MEKDEAKGEKYDKKIMNLWGDLVEIEGQMLHSFEGYKLVLTFCDVKCSIYQGTTEFITRGKIGDFVLSASPISSLLINPQYEMQTISNNGKQYIILCTYS